ncbi:MAG: mechanosensitive ion channel family protein [Pseudorhodoplanes sp.]|uniref:mechanosensitive ion channel family protein n=1 Tax=Pseudorhodoplanes sp. TaxID=1934341 RepID=UPI003D0CE451
MDPKALTDQATTFLSQLSAWAALALPNFVSAVLLFALGWWIAGRAQRAVAGLLDRTSRVDPTLRSVLSSLVRYAILVLVAVAVLGQLGIQTTSILAALGAIGLAIGLAMQGTLSNIAAGLMLLWLRPFRVGDYVDTGSVAGTVKEVGLFASELHTWDGIFLFVPNAQLWNTRITNFSRLPTRLVDLKFAVAYGDDIATGLNVLTELAASDGRVHSEPAPQVFVDELGDSAVILILRVWTATSEYWNLRRDLTRRGKSELEAAGLSFPFPQRDVHIHSVQPDHEAAA